MTTFQENLSTIGHRPRERKRPNVSMREQVVCVAVGAGLVLAALRRFPLGTLLAAGVGAELIRRGVTRHSRLYDRLGIDRMGRPAPPEEYFERGIHVEQSFTIDRDATELYQFWRDFENLPQVMWHLESVTRLDGRRSHWVARGPMGYSLEWDAEVINDEPGRLIAWRSLGGADVDNAGSVRFVPAPGNRGTEVKVVIDYVPPAGRAGARLARLFGKDPERQIREGLSRFKQVMEAGE